MKMISENHFDRIPDDVVRLILNRVLDAKSLCACLAVSTRFNSIAILSTNLSLSVDRIHFKDDSDSDDEDSSKHNLLRSLFRFFISRPLRFLSRLGSASSQTGSGSGAVFYSPSQALNSFANIEILKIKLPSHRELQLDGANDPLLKWKATFGSELKTCVIVAATSVDRISMSSISDRRGGAEQFEAKTVEKNKEEEEEERNRSDAPLPIQPPSPPFAISNEDLKMRVVWTISCLIAASSRHHLLKRIVLEHPMLKSIEMVDENGQGTLTMDEAGISQMRKSVNKNDVDSSWGSDGERSRIPALKMKMWHATELELEGCEKVMKGATMVVIGAADGVGVGEGGVEVFAAEDEMMYGEAAIEIRRKMKRSYSLEMESF